MNVIGHDDVLAYGHVARLDSALGKSDKADVNGIRGEPFLAMVSAKRDEPNRGVHRLMDAREPRRASTKSIHGGVATAPWAVGHVEVYLLGCFSGKLFGPTTRSAVTTS